MPSIPVHQIESFDSGSNYNFNEKMLDPLNARSIFDLSYRTLGTTAEIGVIQPIALIPTLPGDTFKISFNELLRALPTVVPLESRQRQYIYAFYGRMGDYWNDWNTFAKKGYTGDLNLKVPVLEHEKNAIQYNNATDIENKMLSRVWEDCNRTWESNNSILSTSMGETLGLPHNYTEESHTIDGQTIIAYANRTNFGKFIKSEQENYTHEISAIPFMMLLRIWRDYFTNKNYWINDRVILPHDDAEFRLNTDGELISAKNNRKKIVFDIASKKRDIELYQNYYIMGLPYHEFPKDRYTSALPFLQRGTAPSLNYELNSDILKLKNYYDTETQTGIEDENLIRVGVGQGPASDKVLYSYFTEATSSAPNNYFGVKLDNTNIQLSIKMADIRKLAIEQTELEKMARTDGSYAEFGLTFFGKISKNAYDFKPVLIGTTYKEIVYSEVVQTSQSDITPMGSYTGHSTSNIGDYIGSIDCDDYGYIMILSCIMPDVIYSEGLQDHWDRLWQKDIYLPERSKIGMTALLNKRLYFDYGDTEQAEEYNNGLFAYQNYADDYRYHENEVHGDMAEGFNFQFLSYTQSRILGEQQNWGREFALASKENVRVDYLTAPNLAPFTYDIHLGIEAIRKIPYKPIPANLTGL